MARYISPCDTLSRAVKAGLPDGIEYGANALWTRQGDMLSADLTYNNRSFRWVVTDRDMNDQEFYPSRFQDALAALVALSNLPISSPEVTPDPELKEVKTTVTDTAYEKMLEELFGVSLAA